MRIGALPELTVAEARRLALDSQGLGSESAAAVDGDRILPTVRRLGYLQRDPLAVVAPSHQLVLWSRLGSHPRTAVDQALWQRRELFECWAHAASIVPTEDFPLHRHRMRRFAHSTRTWDLRTREWVRAHGSLRREVLSRLATEGPLPGHAFLHAAPTVARGGWGSEGDHQRMLEFLWRTGKVMVAGRDRRGRRWALAEDWLPGQVGLPALPGSRVWEVTAERSLWALGVATPQQVAFYLGGGDPVAVRAAVSRLAQSGRAQQVVVMGRDGPLPGTWFASPGRLEERRRLGLAWGGRTTVLSPFDNLIVDRSRVQQLFGFHYRTEIYVPRARRRYGYYVLPVLHQDRLVGRIDCRRDRVRDRLTVLAVHLETAAAPGAAAPLGAALQRLAQFLDLASVEFEGATELPSAWRRALLA